MITTPLSNCSASPASKIAEFVRHTDAAYERLIRPGDRLMANKRWVAWLDTQDRPGIVRCLWGVDRDANFVGITEPEIAPDAAQSVLAIARAFVSTDAPYGYKGLHVEIWKTLERTPPIADECAPANCVYTVPNPVVFACGTPSSTSPARPSETAEATAGLPIASHMFGDTVRPRCDVENRTPDSLTASSEDRYRGARHICHIVGPSGSAISPKQSKPWRS